MHPTLFANLVRDAIEALPEEIRERMENVEVVVEPYPTPKQLRTGRVGAGQTLYGLYEGVPLTERSTHYAMVLPDKITIFQEPIEELNRTAESIRRQVQRTVVHEIAHHFGIDEAKVRDLGY